MCEFLQSSCDRGTLGRCTASIVVMATSLLLMNVAVAQRADSGKSKDVGIDAALVQKARQVVREYLRRPPSVLELHPYINRINAVKQSD